MVAQAFTVQGGSSGVPGSEKIGRAAHSVLRDGTPLAMLLDGGGHCIQAGQDPRYFARADPLFHDLARMSGWVPMVAAMLGAGFAGPTNYAGMADFVVMVRDLGHFAMCGGRSFDADLALAWPTAEICAMSIEGAVDVAYRREVAAAPDPAVRRTELIAGMRSRIAPLGGAEGFGLDDVIDPRETRARLIAVLDRAPARRQNPMPPKIRSIVPI